MRFKEGLFEAKRVRATDPHSSYLAVEKKVESGTIETDCDKILAVLSKRPDYDGYRPGFTNSEISFEITGKPDKGRWYFKVARRTGELKRDGKIEVVCERTSAIGGGEMQAYRRR